MPEGRFRPEGKLPTSHSHAFDKALDEALHDKGPPNDPDQGEVDSDPYEVTLEVTLRWSPNPGWEVDTYIAKVGRS